MKCLISNIYHGMFQSHNALKLYGAMLLIGILSGCLNDDVKITLVEKSRDGFVAKIIKSNTHATAPFVYSVVVLNKATKRKTKVFRATHLNSLRIEWKPDRKLIISMPCGRVFYFVNAVDIINVDDQRLEGTIEVILKNSGICERYQVKNASEVAS